MFNSSRKSYHDLKLTLSFASILINYRCEIHPEEFKAVHLWLGSNNPATYPIEVVHLVALDYFILFKGGGGGANALSPLPLVRSM